LFGITPELRHPYFLFFEKKKKEQEKLDFQSRGAGDIISSRPQRKNVPTKHFFASSDQH
jgi:hypothetical protein